MIFGWGKKKNNTEEAVTEESVTEASIVGETDSSMQEVEEQEVAELEAAAPESAERQGTEEETVEAETGVQNADKPEIMEPENGEQETADNEENGSAGEETSVSETVVEEKKGFFSRLKEGLTKTRNNIVSGIDSIFSDYHKIDEEFYEELEEILIMGDIGVRTTENILEELKKKVKENHISKPEDCKQFLIQTIKDQMRVEETAYEFEKEQSIVFVIGVNGVGKTTSIGKLAAILKGQGRRVLIAAADTFRAAAGEQLAEWARRSGVEMIGGVEGADPASVIFDGINAAKSRKADVLLCDTAGRLHNKKNLMEELKKMNRIIDREFPHAHRENLLVLDATTGQNAMMQAKEFAEAADLTGIILTKMDGTAKGGIAVAIQSELGIPVKYIGVGERVEDLQKFDSDQFVDALFDVELS